MHAPFVVGLRRSRICERIRKVDITLSHGSRGAVADDDLVKIGWLDKSRERGAPGRIRFHAQRGTDVQLAQPKARADETIKRYGGRFEFHAEVTAVVIHADAAKKVFALHRRFGGPPTVKKFDGLAARFEITAGLG